MVKVKNKVIDTIDIYIGKNLRHFRSQRGISQEELGSFLGKTFQQIQKYERGFNRISAGNLYKVAKHFNKDINDFFTGFNAYIPISEREVKEDKTLEFAHLLNMDIVAAREFIKSMKKF